MKPTVDQYHCYYHCQKCWKH